MAQATVADIDMVRLLIGDTAEQQILRDDQIGRMLDLASLDTYSAAADCADAIAAMYAGRVDVRAGILSSSDSQLSTQYRRLAKDLRSRDDRLTRMGAAPYAGGLTVADREARRTDDTLVRPAFVRPAAHPVRDEELC